MSEKDPARGRERNASGASRRAPDVLAFETAHTLPPQAMGLDDASRGGAASGRPAQPMASGLSCDAWVGRIIDDRYRICALLAEGGMGKVFVAEHLKLRKRVAVKVIHSGEHAGHEMAIRFARESMVTARFDHPHIVSAIDCGTLPEGGAYLVMQFVDGPSLRALLEEKGTLPWEHVCDIAAQIADALVAAHAEGIIHRDLKPENVLLQARNDGTWRVKVLDFGIARMTDEPSCEGVAAIGLTRTGTVVGTPGYMAPEQAMGGIADKRADFYALGVVLWELLAGQKPFVGQSLTEIVSAQLTTDFSHLRSALLKLHLPQAMLELLASMLKPDASHRPADASLLKQAFTELCTRASGSGDALGFHGATVRAATEQGDQVHREQAHREQAHREQRNLPQSPWMQPRNEGRVSGAHRSAQRLTRFFAAHFSSQQGLHTLQTTARTGTQMLWRTLKRLTSQWMDPKRDGENPQHGPAKGFTATRVWPGRSWLRHPAFLSALALISCVIGLAILVNVERSQGHEAPSTTKAPLATAASRQGSDHLPQDGERLAEEAAPYATQLLEATKKADRREASVWLLSNAQRLTLPPYILLAAQLEIASNCKSLASALESIATSSDPRLLPSVMHLANRPRRGCGRFRRSDCLRCVRPDIDAAKTKLETAATTP